MKYQVCINGRYRKPALLKNWRGRKVASASASALSKKLMNLCRMFNFVQVVGGYSRGRIVMAVILGAIMKPILDNGASRPLDLKLTSERASEQKG